MIEGLIRPNYYYDSSLSYVIIIINEYQKYN